MIRMTITKGFLAGEQGRELVGYALLRAIAA